MKLLAAIDRYGRWILLTIVLLFIVTGFGMTKHIIPPRLAREIHLDILPIPLFLLFLIHTFFPVRTQLLKWKIFKERKTADRFAYILFFTLLVLFLWLYFR
ncbi:MAG: hypothetical protein ABH845_02900 [Candidatus Omnitrophota bacterium]